MLISAVLPACGRPTWIRCPAIMIAPRLDTRRRTVSGAGSCGGPAAPARAPRNRCWAGCGSGPAMGRTPARVERAASGRAVAWCGGGRWRGGMGGPGARLGGARGGKAGRDPQVEDLAGGWGEPGGRECHGQRLVRAVGVVLLAPRVDR